MVADVAGAAVAGTSSMAAVVAPSCSGGIPLSTLELKDREPLMTLYKQVSLSHDEVGREIVINLLLRNYIHHKHYQLAEDLIRAVHTPNQQHRSNNQGARFFYYVAVVKAIYLEYADAERSIQHALRKAPEKALGFHIIATKLWLVVQLLKGIIPQRAEFSAPGMQRALEPYLMLTSCVRLGKVHTFPVILSRYEEVFVRDNTLSLVSRIRHNVVKMALTRIAKCYARISFSDIANKLGLEQSSDAEYFVAKAIKDGVIDATMDHENQWVETMNVADIYATTEPACALQRRVVLCNMIHNDARKAMRYGTEDTDAVDGDEERRKQLELETKELAKALEEGVDDGLDDVDF